MKGILSREVPHSNGITVGEALSGEITATKELLQAVERSREMGVTDLEIARALGGLASSLRRKSEFQVSKEEYKE